MTVTLTGSLASDVAAWSPPKPPPTMTTRGRPCGVLESGPMSWLNLSRPHQKRCSRGHNSLTQFRISRFLNKGASEVDGKAFLKRNHADGSLADRSRAPAGCMQSRRAE